MSGRGARVTRDAAFVVLSNSAEGRADELQAWYRDYHLPEARAVPGVRSARLFERRRIEGMPPSAHAFMAVYEMDGEEVDVWEQFERRIAEGEMTMSDALDRDSMSFTVWVACDDAEPA